MQGLENVTIIEFRLTSPLSTQLIMPSKLSQMYITQHIAAIPFVCNTFLFRHFTYLIASFPPKFLVSFLYSCNISFIKWPNPINVHIMRFFCSMHVSYFKISIQNNRDITYFAKLQEKLDDTE